MADGNVTFCSHFKYLGSWVSFSLRDDHNVAKRIASANASMGEITYFWDNDHVNMYSKYLMFREIACNLLLRGCGIWALRQTLLDALEVLLHQSVRRILQIKVRHVIDHRIKNEKVREMFFNIPKICNQIVFRQLTYIRKISRRESTHIPTHLLTA